MNGRDLFPRARAAQWWMLLGLFLMICGARLWLIDRFGNATPFWDEWRSEGAMVQSYLDGTLTLAQFFQPLHEHRSTFTRALCMAWYCLDKQWDPILLMVAQAPLGALAPVAVVFMAGASMSGVARAALAGFAGCLCAAPLTWENALWGFQSCFYLVTLFGVIVIWLCWRNEALTPRWWLGALLGLCNLFTMAGGLFSVVTAATFLTARMLFERGARARLRLAGIAILAAIAVFGFLIMPRLPVQEAQTASSPAAFFWALTGILSWPCSFHWACVLIQAPLLLLAGALVIRRVPLSDGRWFVVIAAGCFWLQALATAWKRNRGWDAVRYCDSWEILLILICSCLVFLRASLGGRWRFVTYPLACLWLFACADGVVDRAVNLAPGQLMDKRDSMLDFENNVREYLHTGDIAWLRRQVPAKTDLFAKILASRTLLSALPPSLVSPNPPLSPLKQKASGGGFQANGYPGTAPPLDKAAIGSYGKNQAEAKSGITLVFNMPPGAGEVTMQVAGYPNAKGVALKIEEPHGASRNIAPPIDPGNQWQSVTVGVKSSVLKIDAKDQSDNAWIAFSMPTASSVHLPGLSARSLAGDALYFVIFGLVFLILGAYASLGENID